VSPLAAIAQLFVPGGTRNSVHKKLMKLIPGALACATVLLTVLGKDTSHSCAVVSDTFTEHVCSACFVFRVRRSLR
jgi:hypothetical protein